MGLATYKWPERLEQVKELPMTPSGKVRKHVLVATLSGQTGALDERSPDLSHK